MIAEMLFAACVIPGCTNPVAALGEPCGDCLRAFGPMLRPTPGLGLLTAEEIDVRDADVRRAYAAQRETSD